MADLAYVEALPTAYGWVWIDRAGFGHRSAAYAHRWQALGGVASGWVQNADGTFTSATVVPVHGYPLDPSLPSPPATIGAPNLAGPGLSSLVFWGAALASLSALGYWWIRRKG